MAYLSLLNHFWKLDRDIHFSPNETRLYMFILNRFNVEGWRCGQIEMTQPEAMSQCGLTLRGLKAARNRLKHFGLIDFKIGGNGRVDKTMYLIPEKGVQKCNPLAKEKGCKNDTLIPEKGVQKCNPLAKENTPTPLKENIYNITREGERDAPAGPRTREGLDFLAEAIDPKSLFREEVISACRGVDDSWREMLVTVIRRWEACSPEIFYDRNRKNKMLNWLRVEAEELRKQRLSVTSKPIEERKRLFMDEIKAVRDAGSSDFYNRTILNDFYKFFTQPAGDGSMLAFETKPYWDTKTRLDKWIQQENRHRP